MCIITEFTNLFSISNMEMEKLNHIFLFQNTHFT